MFPIFDNLVSYKRLIVERNGLKFGPRVSFNIYRVLLKVKFSNSLWCHSVHSHILTTFYLETLVPVEWNGLKVGTRERRGNYLVHSDFWLWRVASRTSAPLGHLSLIHTYIVHFLHKQLLLCLKIERQYKSYVYFCSILYTYIKAGYWVVTI